MKVWGIFPPPMGRDGSHMKISGDFLESAEMEVL
jgi:hypothetical protein